MAKVTMRDIAKLAGVSPTTVAHALNNTPQAQVAEATRERVWKVAKELGYQRSLLERSIKESLRHLCIAVGRRGQEDEADTAAIFEGIREVALSKDYVPILYDMPTGVGETDSTEAVERIGELFKAKLIDGLIVDKQCFTNVSVRELHSLGIPVVTVNGSFEATTAKGEPIPGITYDNRAGGLQATQHLLEQGHRRIALLTRPFFRYEVAYRPMIIRDLLAGHKEALEDAGVAWDASLHRDASPADREGIEAVVSELMGRAEPPTAWFVADDAMAVIVANVLRKQGRRVPEEVSVMGYGDQPVPVRLAEPPLTTVRTDLVENGRQAAVMIIDLVEGRPSRARQLKLVPELAVRGSTGKK